MLRRPMHVYFIEYSKISSLVFIIYSGFPLEQAKQCLPTTSHIYLTSREQIGVKRFIVLHLICAVIHNL